MHHFERAVQPDLHNPTVRPFTTPIAGQFRTVLTRAPQRRDSAASGPPRKLHLKTGISRKRTIEPAREEGSPTRPDPTRNENDYHADQLAGSAKGS
jgi:hypothetical protein